MSILRSRVLWAALVACMVLFAGVIALSELQSPRLDNVNHFGASGPTYRQVVAAAPGSFSPSALTTAVSRVAEQHHLGVAYAADPDSPVVQLIDPYGHFGTGYQKLGDGECLLGSAVTGQPGLTETLTQHVCQVVGTAPDVRAPGNELPMLVMPVKQLGSGYYELAFADAAGIDEARAALNEVWRSVGMQVLFEEGPRYGKPLSWVFNLHRPYILFLHLTTLAGGLALLVGSCRVSASAKPWLRVVAGLGAPQQKAFLTVWFSMLRTAGLGATLGTLGVWLIAVSVGFSDSSWWPWTVALSALMVGCTVWLALALVAAIQIWVQMRRVSHEIRW